VREQVAKLDKAELDIGKLRDEIAAVRRTLLEETAPAVVVADIARQRAQDQLTDLMLNAQSLGDLEKARTRYSQLARERSSHDLGPNYLEGFDPSFIDEIGDRIEEMMREEVTRTLEQWSPPGGRPYEQLKRTLQPYLKRDRVGAKTDIQQLVADSVVNAYHASTDSAKRIFLRTFFEELQRGYV
jgi:hypothetical protein